MRDIKFRIWLPGIKKMTTYTHTIEDLMNWGTKEWSNGTAIFLQFTGLYDRNGKEIYEGDVVESQYFKPSEVTFKNGGFYFWDITPADAESTYPDVQWEIKGNIYEKKALTD